MKKKKQIKIAPAKPWKKPFGEALIDWPRFSKWLLSKEARSCR